MRVALVHDYIKEYGGAERVLEALHELYPDADVYTSVYLPKFLGPHRERFKNWKIKTSWFQYVPLNYKLISPFRLLSAWTFARFDLSNYDVVIVSATGAYFPNAIETRIKNQEARIKEENGHAPYATRHKPVHICYCHTPPRYLYGYATAREWKKHKFFAFLAGVANHFLRIVDYRASQNVDYYIANSEEVASRIRKFYRREATVVYPPVDIKNQEARIKKQEKKGYYLTGGRLARAKHVDIILQACHELGVPLKIFGKGFAGYEEELKIQNSKLKTTTKNSKVEFLGEVTDAETAELMAGAKAFLFASEDEDFGIVPVEAMAHGLAVIAHKSGGVRETVIEGKTGLFFNKLTVESLVKAMKQFNNITISSNDCRKQAEKFSKKRFLEEMKAFVGSKGR